MVDKSSSAFIFSLTLKEIWKFCAAETPTYIQSSSGPNMFFGGFMIDFDGEVEYDASPDICSAPSKATLTGHTGYWHFPQYFEIYTPVMA